MHTEGVNKVVLMGNCASEPDIRYYPSGDAVTVVTLATCEKWIDRKTGERKSLTEWHKIIFRDGDYTKVGEQAGYTLYKGAKVYVEGKLKTKRWEGRSGKQAKLEIIGNHFELLSEPKKEHALPYREVLAALG